MDPTSPSQLELLDLVADLDGERLPVRVLRSPATAEMPAALSIDPRWLEVAPLSASKVARLQRWVAELGQERPIAHELFLAQDRSTLLAFLNAQGFVSVPDAPTSADFWLLERAPGPGHAPAAATPYFRDYLAVHVEPILGVQFKAADVVFSADPNGAAVRIASFREIDSTPYSLRRFLAAEGLDDAASRERELAAWRLFAETPARLPSLLSIRGRLAGGLVTADQEVEYAVAFSRMVLSAGFVPDDAHKLLPVYRRPRAGHPDEIIVAGTGDDGTPRYRLASAAELASASEYRGLAGSEGDFTDFLRANNLPLDLLPQGLPLSLPLQHPPLGRALDQDLADPRRVLSVVPDAASRGPSLRPAAGGEADDLPSAAQALDEQERASLSPVEAAGAIRVQLRSRGITTRQVSVRAESSSLDSSIDVRIKDVGVKKSVVEAIANTFAHVRRDGSGDILAGGNRYVDVAYTDEALAPLVAQLAPTLAALPKDGAVIALPGGVFRAFHDDGDYVHVLNAAGEELLRCWGSGFAANQLAAWIADHPEALGQSRGDVSVVPTIPYAMAGNELGAVPERESQLHDTAPIGAAQAGEDRPDGDRSPSPEPGPFGGPEAAHERSRQIAETAVIAADLGPIPHATLDDERTAPLGAPGSPMPLPLPPPLTPEVPVLDAPTPAETAAPAGARSHDGIGPVPPLPETYILLEQGEQKIFLRTSLAIWRAEGKSNYEFLNSRLLAAIEASGIESSGNRIDQLASNLLAPRNKFKLANGWGAPSEIVEAYRVTIHPDDRIAVGQVYSPNSPAEHVVIHTLDQFRAQVRAGRRELAKLEADDREAALEAQALDLDDDDEAPQVEVAQLARDETSARAAELSDQDRLEPFMQAQGFPGAAFLSAHGFHEIADRSPLADGTRLFLGWGGFPAQPLHLALSESSSTGEPFFRPFPAHVLNKPGLNQPELHFGLLPGASLTFPEFLEEHFGIMEPVRQRKEFDAWIDWNASPHESPPASIETRAYRPLGAPRGELRAAEPPSPWEPGASWFPFPAFLAAQGFHEIPGRAPLPDGTLLFERWDGEPAQPVHLGFRLASDGVPFFRLFPAHLLGEPGVNSSERFLYLNPRDELSLSEFLAAHLGIADPVRQRQELDAWSDWNASPHELPPLRSIDTRALRPQVAPADELRAAEDFARQLAAMGYRSEPLARGTAAPGLQRVLIATTATGDTALPPLLWSIDHGGLPRWKLVAPADLSRARENPQFDAFHFIRTRERGAHELAQVRELAVELDSSRPGSRAPGLTLTAAEVRARGALARQLIEASAALPLRRYLQVHGFTAPPSALPDGTLVFSRPAVVASSSTAPAAAATSAPQEEHIGVKRGQDQEFLCKLLPHETVLALRSTDRVVGQAMPRFEAIEGPSFPLYELDGAAGAAPELTAAYLAQWTAWSAAEGLAPPRPFEPWRQAVADDRATAQATAAILTDLEYSPHTTVGTSPAWRRTTPEGEQWLVWHLKEDGSVTYKEPTTAAVFSLSAHHFEDLPGEEKDRLRLAVRRTVAQQRRHDALAFYEELFKRQGFEVVPPASRTLKVPSPHRTREDNADLLRRAKADEIPQYVVFRVDHRGQCRWKAILDDELEVLADHPTVLSYDRLRGPERPLADFLVAEGLDPLTPEQLEAAIVAHAEDALRRSLDERTLAATLPEEPGVSVPEPGFVELPDGRHVPVEPDSPEMDPEPEVAPWSPPASRSPSERPVDPVLAPAQLAAETAESMDLGATPLDVAGLAAATLVTASIAGDALHGSEAALAGAHEPAALPFYPGAASVEAAGSIVWGPELATTPSGLELARLVLWTHDQQLHPVYLSGDMMGAVASLEVGQSLTARGYVSEGLGALWATTLDVPGRFEPFEQRPNLPTPDVPAITAAFGASPSLINDGKRLLPRVLSFDEAKGQAFAAVTTKLEQEDLAAVLREYANDGMSLAPSGLPLFRNAFDSQPSLLPESLAGDFSRWLEATAHPRAAAFTFAWPTPTIDRHFDDLVVAGGLSAQGQEEAPLARLGIRQSTLDATQFRNEVRQDGDSLAVRSTDREGRTLGVHFLEPQDRDFLQASRAPEGQPGLWTSAPPSVPCAAIILAMSPLTHLAYHQLHPREDVRYVALGERAAGMTAAQADEIRGLLTATAGDGPLPKLVVLGDLTSSGAKLSQDVHKLFADLTVETVLQSANFRARTWIEAARQQSLPELYLDLPAYAASRLALSELYRSPDGRQVVMQTPGSDWLRVDTSRVAPAGRLSTLSEAVMFERDSAGVWQYRGDREHPEDKGDALTFARSRLALSPEEFREDVRRFQLEQRYMGHSRALQPDAPEVAARGLYPETLEHPAFAGTLRTSGRTDGPGLAFALQDRRGFCGIALQALGGHEVTEVDAIDGVWMSNARPGTGKQPDRIVIVSHPWDALAHHQENPSATTRYVAMDDPRSNAVQREALLALVATMKTLNHDRAPAIVVAASRDRAGEEFYLALKQVLPTNGLQRDPPSLGRSWSQSVQMREQAFIRAHTDDMADKGLSL